MEDINNTEKTPKKEKKKKKIKPIKKSRTGFLKFLQHVFIAIAGVGIFVVVVGSTITIKTAEGEAKYNLSASDEGRKYEDSVLFNTIYGNEISDVLRLITIRSQLETNGKYDPNKVIDVVAYNTRTTPSSEDNGNVTVQYYLGDLLKWSRYGFDYEEVNRNSLSPSANNLLNNDYDGYNDGESYEDMPATYELLVNRYKNIDGLSLEEYASSWDEYDYLASQIEQAANDLYTNYTEYLKLNDYFRQSTSNIRYYAQMGDGNDKTVYSNIDVEEKISQTFREYGRYINYNYDTMVYKTNTAINESTFNSLISKYEYAYTDNCNLYIGVDMSMLADDSIAAGSKGFNNYLPYYDQLVAVIVICVILYLVLLVYCTVKEGIAVKEDGTKYIEFKDFDHTSIEWWVVLLCIVMGLIPYLLYCIQYVGFDFLRQSNEMYYRIAIGGCIFIYDILVLGLYYSLVRRIKGHHIWKQCLLKRCIDFIKKSYYAVYDNGSIVIRSWVPYIVFGIINLLCLGIIATSAGLPSFLSLIVMVSLDIAAGIFIYKQVYDRQSIVDGMHKIVDGDISYKATTDSLHGDNKELAECVNSIGDTIRNAVEQSMKDERMKADLIANVSHDIRTPLTSIINYVDLIKREDVDNDNIRSYVQILDEKSQRLKTLTDDLIEASKVSSGNVELDLQRMNLTELLNQSIAEFAEKFEEKNLSLICRDEKADNTVIMADGQSLWRVIENLFVNVYKYSMPSSRVYIDLFNVTTDSDKLIVFQMRNMSENTLPGDLTQLTERFIRGDASRTSEGSGLGLSIAKSLTELMGGTFEIASDADLFKVELSFKVC